MCGVKRAVSSGDKGEPIVKHSLSPQRAEVIDENGAVPGRYRGVRVALLRAPALGAASPLTASAAPDSLFLASLMAVGKSPGTRTVSNTQESTSAPGSAPGGAQLSPPSGVSTDVSSAAIDRGLLSFAGIPSSAPAASANSLEVVSDADVMLRVNPEVAKALKLNNARLLNEMEELTKKTIIIKSDPALHQEQFDIH